MQAQPLGPLPYVIYGTTRLGDSSIPRAQRVELALKAMERGVPFHTSSSYGEAVGVLAEAFRQDPIRIPKLAIKLFGESTGEIRKNAEKYVQGLGIPRIEYGQLCPGGAVWEQIAQGGGCYADFRTMKAEGLVGHFVLEVFPWTSPAAFRALKGGHLDGQVDALIFYFNPLQRFVSNELWDLILERRTPWIALRSVSGGDLYQLRDVPGAAWKPYLRDRAAQVAPLYERSGARSWPEFCVRFAASFDQVLATVGSSSRLERLDALIEASKEAKPLAMDIIHDLLALQRDWSEKVDMPSEPWSM